MNVFLWVLQGVLAFLYLAGGVFKTFNPDDVAKQITALPRAGWVVLGAVEVLGAVLLIVPAAVKWMPMLTPLAAAVLTLETLALAALYASYSLKLAATNPLVWAVPMGLMAALVAYGRYWIHPPG
jgi:DoxX-like family